MRGLSRDALAAAEERLEPVLKTVDGLELGEQLYAVVGLLDSSVGVRRALTESTRDEQDRVALAERLLGGKVAPATLDVVSGAVRQRWSVQRDLADALEHLGSVAVLASAQRAGNLESVEDEVFRFSRVVLGDEHLLAALDDRANEPAQRTGVIDRLLGRKVTPQTLALVRQVAAAPRGRRVEGALEDLVELAAARRSRIVAVVTTATPLSVTQRDRLTAALGRIYGRGVLLEEDVDPEVLGGLRVRVGDEILDATVLSRMDDARRRLAG
jgi:F-type H+-transporting ATPase subunit delta